MKKEIVREYDEAGNLTKETITEYEEKAVYAPLPNYQCVCNSWTNYSYWCPVHGHRLPGSIWNNGFKVSSHTGRQA